MLVAVHMNGVQVETVTLRNATTGLNIAVDVSHESGTIAELGWNNPGSVDARIAVRGGISEDVGAGQQGTRRDVGAVVSDITLEG